MTEVLAEWWWVFLIGLIVYISLSTFILVRKIDEPTIEAQVIEPISFIGCLMVLFNLVGIISAVLSIISGAVKVFLWWVGS